MAEIRLILAAGGVVSRKRKDALEVAVISRSRYPGEKSLPKGKLDPGESFEDAARREVLEETNIDAKIVDYLGVVDYRVKGRPKLVVFYEMEQKRARKFTVNDEVSALEWMPPAKARDALTYEPEREILERWIARRRRAS